MTLTCDLASYGNWEPQQTESYSILKCFNEFISYLMAGIYLEDDQSLPQLFPSSSQSTSKTINTSVTSPTSSTNHGHNYMKDENFSQATLLLHEACENGDTKSVEQILCGGKANLNSLIGGHRTYRSALHKASAYGHINAVKLLLQAGACAEMCSSVQRTALHEACMGGHRATVVELVHYVKDLDMVDNNGQTAAHIAAYHGETDCLKVLIDNGCDLDCEDNQNCTAGHLAVLKNHPVTLRCLLTKNIDILKHDGQGRTPVHYAGLYGSVNCLKVFKEYHVDLKITDHNGCNTFHHSSSGGHVNCLKFLTKVGLPLDGKDKLGKTSAHYAAQKGSTECLHWLLEQGLDASIADDSGNTPAHSAASGHMEAMNCLFLHNSDMLFTNTLGDTPEMLSRKFGNTIAYQKAVNGTIRCPFCIKQQKQREYDLRHQPSEVEKNIKSEEKVIFKSPVKASTKKPKTQKKGALNPVHESNAKRNLSAKYYGEHLFSLTSEQGKHLKTTQRNEKKL